MKPPLVVLLALLALTDARAHGGMTLRAPESARRGEPVLVVLAPVPIDAPAAGFTVSVVFSDGSERARHPGVRLRARPRGGREVEGAGPSALTPRVREASFLVSMAIRAPLGEAWLVARDSHGEELARRSFSVVNRVFSRQDLYLNEALTSLRLDPDPLKTEQAKRYQALLASIDPEADYLDGGFVRPVASERRTTLFGLRRRYLYADGGIDVTDHNGIDYGSPLGSPVVAAGRGRVVMAEDRIVTGKTVILEHLPGAYTIYMHLDHIATSSGELLERGEPVGTVGMTGLATGPHLHWEFRVMGQACDPEAMIGLRLP